MSNFLPKAFKVEGEHSCDICHARHKFENSMDTMKHLLHVLLQEMLTAGGVEQSLAGSTIKLVDTLYTVQSSYQMSVNTNFCIWFAAEQHGRAKDVKELLLGYDEYRDTTVAVVGMLKSAFESFCRINIQTATHRLDLRDEVAALTVCYESLLTASENYWTVANRETDKRRQDALRTK